VCLMSHASIHSLPSSWRLCCLSLSFARCRCLGVFSAPLLACRGKDVVCGREVVLAFVQLKMAKVVFSRVRRLMEAFVEARARACGRCLLRVGWFSIFFFGWCYSYGPQQGPDRQQKKKRREGSSRGESKRKLLKETQNQRKETRKKKKIK